MKLNCGPTREERWKLEQQRLSNWHLWFAWRPVRVGPTECRWLESVWRKGTRTHCFDFTYWEWEYYVGAPK